jgi:hypothetical protein
MINFVKVKKNLTIIFSLIFLLVGAGFFGWMIIRGREGGKIVSPVIEGGPTPTPEIEWGLWQDQYGFSFEYPTILEPKQEEIEGKDSVVVLSSSAGKITVSFGEAPQETIEKWFKAYKEATSSSQVEDIKLSDKPAKKIFFDEGKRILTAMIDEWDLIIIDGDLRGDELLNKAYEKILISFYLEPVSEEKVTTSGGGEGVEGEELFLEGEIEE